MIRPVVRAAAVVLLVALTPVSVHCATLVVNDTADAVDAVPGDGICATPAGSCTLRAAVQEANASAEDDWITVPTGNFLLVIAGAGEDAGAAGDLDITDSVTITGAGAETIIDGAMLDRIFDIHPAAVRVDLASATLRNGQAMPGIGGAIRINASPAFTMNVAHVAFDGNTASDGGAVAMTPTGGSGNSLPELTILRSTFDRNQASNRGGAIYTDRAAMVLITHCEMGTRIGNSAGGHGGAIYAEGAVDRVLIERIQWSTLANNIAGGDGGALYAEAANGSVGITQTTMAGNTAARGGGIYACCATPPFPVIGVSGLDLSVGVSTFSGNRALGAGGAAYLESNFHIVATTVAQNSATAIGGIERGFFGRGSILNSILSNTGGNCGSAGGQYNVSSDSTCGGTGALLSTDAMLGPLGDNGGPTHTHAPLPGSPAIDLIPPEKAVVRVDQRGVARPYGPRSDAGALEVSSTPPVATATTLIPPPYRVVTGQAVTLQAEVIPAPSYGMVVFRDGDVILGSADSSQGPFRLTIPSLSPGEHFVTASFMGDLSHSPSTSPAFVLQVAAVHEIPMFDLNALVILATLLAAIGCYRSLGLTT